MNHLLGHYLLGDIVRNCSNTLHLFKMLGCVIGVDHFVLDSDIVATKDQDGFATGMVKVGNIINDAINGNFGSRQTLERADSLLGGSRIDLVVCQLRLAQSQLVCIGGHLEEQQQIG